MSDFEKRGTVRDQTDPTAHKSHVFHSLIATTSQNGKEKEQAGMLSPVSLVNVFLIF